MKAPERVGILPRTALRIPVEGEPELVDLDRYGDADNEVLGHVQRLVGGHIESVAMPDDDGLKMLVHEDAPPRAPTNVRATLLLQQTVRGDVVIVRESIGSPRDWVSLRDDDVPMLCRFKLKPEARS